MSLYECPFFEDRCDHQNPKDSGTGRFGRPSGGDPAGDRRLSSQWETGVPPPVHTSAAAEHRERESASASARERKKSPFPLAKARATFGAS